MFWSRSKKKFEPDVQSSSSDSNSFWDINAPGFDAFENFLNSYASGSKSGSAVVSAAPTLGVAPSPMASPSVHFTTAQAAVQLTRHNAHWGATIGQSPGPVTFAFRQSPPPYTVTGEPLQSSFQLVSSIAERRAAEVALASWSSFGKISFSEVNSLGYSNNAAILFGNYRSATDGAQAFAFLPTSGDMAGTSYQGDVWLNTVYESTTSLPYGSYDYLAFMHEIGHALGLEHPGDYNAGPGQVLSYANNAAYVEDSLQYSIMSYWGASNTGANHVYNGHTVYASTPLLHDIAALQRLYGVNTTTRTGNTTYGFHGNASGAYDIVSATQQVVYCIWDSGGVNTLDASGYATNQTLNLNAGQFSNIGALTSNVSIAAGTIVQVGIGGSGNDILIGNNSADQLYGGAGNDTLYAGAGISTLYGGDGIDTLAGTTGKDRFVGGAGADRITVGSGISILEYDQTTDFGDVVSNLHTRVGAKDVFDLHTLFANSARAFAGLTGADAVAAGYIQLIAGTNGNTSSYLMFDSDGRTGAAAAQLVATLNGTSDGFGHSTVTSDMFQVR